MTAPIRRLTADEFTTLLHATAPMLTRRIDAIHLHHTWRPNRWQFKGQATIEAIRTFHQKNGWDDIAQHLTIDPQGLAWTGRNWNSPPASQRGRNGDPAAGPFMIEIVGDFDAERDRLDGDQRGQLIKIVASLLTECGLTTANIHFHRELGSPKTCPGSGVDKPMLLRQIQAALPAPPRAPTGAKPAAAGRRASPLPFDVTYLLGYDLTSPANSPPTGYDAWEIPENEFAAEDVFAETRARVRARDGVDGRDLGTMLQRTWEVLRPYVVNLTKGRLSQSGEFCMPDNAIERIMDSIGQYAERTEQPRVMLHAHGGLVKETDALAYARDAREWWLRQGVYPVYFVWETHLFEVLKQRLGLARAGVGDVRDFMFEATASFAGGGAIWGDMKESARLASSLDAGGGEAGGARIFAEALAQLIASKPAGRTITVHAVGHSAGAIFHAHLLPVLLGNGLDVESLALLAPAVRTDVFKDRLFDAINQGRVKFFTMYTMEEEAEREDDLVEPLGITLYGKSLLYLVSRAFEPKRKTPLLGLEEMIGADQDVERLLKAPGRLELSRAKGNEPNPATTARRHGCFDNDAATMASAFRAITGRPPGTPFEATDKKCDEDGSRALRDLPFILPTFIPSASVFAPAGPMGRAALGGRRALCVGIDNYRDSPLAGCVRDATTWATALAGLQFNVITVLDRDATRQHVLDALQVLVEGSRSGDMLVFQYAGHGTQAVDLAGDESDRYDEALVPVDYHTGALLLDDDLADLYRRLPVGVVLTLFMDCCHSGTNSRFAPLDRSRTRGSERRRFLELPAEVQEAHRQFRARAGSPAPTSAEESLPGVIHFAACLDNQYAYESDGQGHFTRVATAALAAAVSRGASNEDYGSDVATKVIAIGKPQTPRLMRLPAELSGKPLLGAPSGEALAGRPPALAVPAGTSAWDQWCLEFFEAGAAHWRQRLGR